MCKFPISILIWSIWSIIFWQTVPVVGLVLNIWAFAVWAMILTLHHRACYDSVCALWEDYFERSHLLTEPEQEAEKSFLIRLSGR